MEMMTFGEWMAALALLVGIASFIFVIVNRKRDASKKRDTAFEIYGKPSNQLTPEEVMQDRANEMYNYRDKVYHLRDHDQQILGRIQNGQNVLVTGIPLAGKTRAVYEAFKNCCYPVYKPARLDNFRYEELKIPENKRPMQHSILFLDDLNKLMTKQNFYNFLQRYILRDDIIIVATCREGEDLKPLEDKVDMDQFGNHINVGEITRGEAEKVSEEAGLGELRGFEKAIGTVFMKPLGMMERYIQCSDTEKGILNALKRLYVGGIYEGKEEFDIFNVKLVASELENVDLNESEWKKHLRHLQERRFFILQDEMIQVPDVYLEQVIPTEYKNKDALEELSKLFWDDGDALDQIAYRTDEIGQHLLEKEKYLILKINTLERSLQLTDRNNKPENWAVSQNNLGNAYHNLATIRETEQNLDKAIKAFQKALEIQTPDKFPNEYAGTQNNLGTAYRYLAPIRETEQNLNKAIKAYQKALEIRTQDKFPNGYAMTQNNLGNAYRGLSAIRETEQNLDKAIKAYQKALKIRTPDKFPNDYAMTQNNLGNAYRNLAAIGETEQNLDKAIEAYQKALEIRTKDKFPNGYAMTQNNLGNAYCNLAAIGETEQNLDKAIEAYQKALDIYRSDKFPNDYAMTQNNLGNAYSNLSDIRKTDKNHKNAIEAFQEALKVRTLEKFPYDYAMTQNNLGYAYNKQAAIRETEKNLKNALEAFQEALKVNKQNKSPNDYAITQINLGNVYFKLAEIEEKSENCQKAESCYLEAKKIFEAENIQTHLKSVNKNLALLEKLMDEDDDGKSDKTDGNESPT